MSPSGARSEPAANRLAGGSGGPPRRAPSPHDSSHQEGPKWVNNPTLTEFCFGMIGRADIEGSKSDVAMNAWPPQASSLLPTAQGRAAVPGRAAGSRGTLSGRSSPYLKRGPHVGAPTNTLASVGPPSPCTAGGECGRVGCGSPLSGRLLAARARAPTGGRYPPALLLPAWRGFPASRRFAPRPPPERGKGGRRTRGRRPARPLCGTS